jgi:hypothetical protein
MRGGAFSPVARGFFVFKNNFEKIAQVSAAHRSTPAEAIMLPLKSNNEPQRK